MRRQVRKFCPAEDAQLIELRMIHNGIPGNGGLKIIAKKMGRSLSSVAYRLRFLARQDAD